jgi:hypothetical protein
MFFFWVFTPCGFIGRHLGASALKMETVCFPETLVSIYKCKKQKAVPQHTYGSVGGTGGIAPTYS